MPSEIFMLNAIIRLALRYRFVVVFLSLVVLVYGSFTTLTLPIDVFPDLDRPRVVIMTEVTGEAAEEVETLVTTPLERAMLGATGVQAVRSQSGPGLSVVTVEFGWGTPIYTARQVVQERLATVTATLPPDVHPQLAPIGSILGQIMLIGISRSAGPSGGVLASVGNTYYMAELVIDPKNAQVTVCLWNPRDDNKKQRIEKVADWVPLAIDARPLTLSGVDLPGGGMTLQPYREKNGKTARFRGQENRWQTSSATPPADVDRWLTISVAGKAHKVVFGSLQNRMMDLRTTADWIVRPRLLKINGIAQVFVMGEGRKQYQVLAAPAKLLEFSVSLEEVEQALRKCNVNASGGYAELHMEEQPIRFLGRLGPQPEKVLADLRQVPIKKIGRRTITLQQVADVTLGPAIKRGDSAVNGSPGILLTIARQPHFDTRSLTDQVLAGLHELEQVLPADIDINPNFFQMKRFIDRGVYNVAEALVVGAVLVLIILFLFLLNFRTTFISLTAIPLSLALTALTFKWIGWITGQPLSINVMTLGGIAVAMGELVDDAIVDVENIFRRLRENNVSASPKPALRVIYEASVEVRGAIVFGTAMVILVFLPLFALSGLEGRLFAPMGVAYIVSILASLLVSLTVTPVLSYYLLPQAKATHRTTDSPLLRALKWLAGHLVRFSMSHAGVLLLAGWILFAICVLTLTRLGSGLLPDFDEGTVQMTVQLPPGSSLKANNKIAPQIESRLKEMTKSPSNPNGMILGFLRRSGRSELEEHADPVSESEFLIGINPDCGIPRNVVREKIRKDILDSVPGITADAEQPLKHLMNEMLSGSKGDIAIRIYGDDLDKLYAAAVEVKNALAGIDGLADPSIESQKQVTEFHIKPKPDKLAHYNVDRKLLANWVQTALMGQVVSEVLEGQKRFDLIVRFSDEARTDYKKLGELRVDLPSGKGWVPLKELADINEYGRGANVISHDNGKRRIVVKCTPTGRDVGSVVADIQKRVREGVTLPPGYFVEYGGQFESQQEATRVITLLGALAVIGMFVVLYVLYPSTRIVLQILNALPMAFIGGVLALMLTRQPVTVAALVGFISLGGIAARNGILLVSHYFHLMKHEGEGFTEAMVLRGSLERLSPVLMTALTAGIGLVPLVLGGHQPGREILYPVATVILGGLITSTLCEFLLHPGLFWKFSGKAVASGKWQVANEDVEQVL
jgi:CzcA family heavy metal efflux pump